VLGKPGIQIVGYIGVEMLPGDALKDVDIFHDGSACAKAPVSAKASRLR
jgi:hypothetical protein